MSSDVQAIDAFRFWRINFVGQEIYESVSPDNPIYTYKEFAAVLPPGIAVLDAARLVIGGILQEGTQRFLSSFSAIIQDNGIQLPDVFVFQKFYWYIIKPFYKTYVVYQEFDASSVNIRMSDCFDTELTDEYTIVGDFLTRTNTVQDKGTIRNVQGRSAMPGNFVLSFFCTWKTKKYASDSVEPLPTYSLGSVDNPIRLEIKINNQQSTINNQQSD